MAITRIPARLSAEMDDQVLARFEDGLTLGVPITVETESDGIFLNAGGMVDLFITRDAAAALVVEIQRALGSSVAEGDPSKLH